MTFAVYVLFAITKLVLFSIKQKFLSIKLKKNVKKDEKS